ncbi:MAG TPA: hypothetical protein VFL51_11920 [Pseudolabrys sp.]|nr:hypothetical protein [Pseudolabrys sp.]
MTVLRAILVSLVAISVSIPMTGNICASASNFEMAMPASADVPCCPNCGGLNPDKNSTACAFKCINFVGVILPAAAAVQPHLVTAHYVPIVNETSRQYMTSPPMRPPRV